tara:strand:- start:536 stop:1699 length:1164 start_codon:yes stop_codon:yes gene_type:complete
MPTNVFFNQAVQTEQNLVEDLVVESLRMYGHNVYYLPRKIVNEDTILGEAANSSFEDAYEVEMYLEGIEGFEGEGDLYSKFGVEVRDSATFVISRRSWERFVSLDVNLATGLRPNEGDLIYFPLSQSLFEIKFVEHENPFYQLGKMFVFKMSCDLFEYSGEKFDTEVEALDTDLELAQAAALELTLADTPTLRDFVQGESVSQMVYPGIVISGIVSSWSEDTNKLTVSSLKTTDTGDPATYSSFLTTDTADGNIEMEATSEGDRIVMAGAGQEGYFIDFEDATALVVIPSFITDGTSGTDNILDADSNSFLLEDGTTTYYGNMQTTTDSTAFDYIVVEDSLASRRNIISIASDLTLSTDPGAFNLDLETDADGIIDFSESNPFGEAT